MKIKLLFINQTEGGWIGDGLAEYVGRLKRYLPLEIREINSPVRAGKSRDIVLREEGEKILSLLKPSDKLVLLDESGAEYSSVELSVWLNKKMVAMSGDLVMVVGGAYGFSDELASKAVEKISLSRLTFTHQMVRVILVEQLYRAMTILRNEPYHHS